MIGERPGQFATATLAFLPTTAAVFGVSRLAPALIPRFGSRRLMIGGQISLIGTLTGTAVCILIYGAPEILATDWLHLPPVVWWVVIYLAVGPTAIRTVLRRVP